jgi:uncharacterized protein (TIGR02145 family)
MPDKYRKTIPSICFHSLGLLLLFVLFISSCERLEIKRITKVSTGSVSDITASSAIVQGNIIEQGEGGIKKYGHCWSLSPGPTISNDKTELGKVNTTGTYNSEMVDLAPGNKYYVRAYATDNDGTSYGNEISFITLNIPVPQAPTNLAADPESSTQITLSWTDNSDNEVGFKIERSPNGNTDWAEIAIVDMNVTNFQNNNLDPNTSYCYRVRSFNAGGNSGYSNTARTTTSPDESIIPVPPGNPAAEAISTSQINLFWEDNSQNEAGFKIERSTDNINWDVIGTVGPNETVFQDTGLEFYGPYFYRIRSFNAAGDSDPTNTVEAFACVSPTANTIGVINFGTTFATLVGQVNSPVFPSVVTFEYGPTMDYGYAIEFQGNPVLTDFSTFMEVSAELTDLSPNTAYHFRVTAANCGGTSYGEDFYFETDPFEVYDASDNVYGVVRIGTQLWMKENLRNTIYNDNSDLIPNVTDILVWLGLSTPAYCWYNNDVRYKELYGALYNWYAVSTGKLCPNNMHVPTDADWRILTNFLGGEEFAGGKIKEAGFDHWGEPNTDATNESGFTALPGGCQYGSGGFALIGSHGYWWTSSEYSDGVAWYRHLSLTWGGIDREYSDARSGYSVRCIRDY